MNVSDLVKQGAQVDISFHDCADVKEAYKKIQPYRELGKVKIDNRNGIHWVKVKNDNISVVAFYNKEEN